MMHFIVRTCAAIRRDGSLLLAPPAYSKQCLEATSDKCPCLARLLYRKYHWQKPLVERLNYAWDRRSNMFRYPELKFWSQIIHIPKFCLKASCLRWRCYCYCTTNAPFFRSSFFFLLIALSYSKLHSLLLYRNKIDWLEYFNTWAEWSRSRVSICLEIWHKIKNKSASTFLPDTLRVRDIDPPRCKCCDSKSIRRRFLFFAIPLQINIYIYTITHMWRIQCERLPERP